MLRSTFALIIRTCFLVGLASCPCAAADQPNVLLIITDDQGYGDFSIHGNPHIQTPNIDQLGASSVRFDRYYVNSFCAPTRAALLTGRWPVRTGVHGVTHNKEAMRPSEVTIAESLSKAGYHTACIGKWHNGEQFPFTPQGQGFVDAYGRNNGHWNNYFDSWLLRGAKFEKAKGYISDVLTDEAIKVISDHQHQPFFCYLAYNAPHSPFQVPDSYFDKFKAKGFDDSVSAFYGMCENIDDNVGRLLKHLDQLQLAENTIVLFMTDNGGTAGVKLFNAGMRGGKTSVHEGGTRVPLFVRWPAAKWSPHVVKPLAAHVDIYPTLMDLCRVTPLPGPKLDGASLRPLLESETPAAWPDRILFTHNPINEDNRYPGAVRTQTHRLVREIAGKSGGSGATANDEAAKAWQLYDMVRDPGQSKDIASEYPQLVNELAAKYEAWIDDIFSEGLVRFPIPVGYAEHNPVELYAPQAYFDKPLKFMAGPGFAHDWLTGWTDADSKIWFDVDIVRDGAYEIEIALSCPDAEAGSTVRVDVGQQSLEFSVPPAPPVDIALAHRDADGHTKYRDRDWAKVSIGSLHLPQGKARIALQPTKMRGQQVMDFKHLKLTRKESAR